MKNKFLHLLNTFFLTSLVLISTRLILINKSIISHNDSFYDFAHSFNLNRLTMTWSDNYLGLDQINTIFIYFYKNILYYILNYLRFPDHLISYVTTFGAVIFTSILFYVLTFNISKSKILGLFSGVFVVFSNLALEHIGFGAFYFFYGLSGMYLVIYFLYKIYKNIDNKKTNITLLLISSVLLVHPFYFVSLILFLFLTFFIFKTRKLFLLKDKMVIILSIFFIHLYWLLPFLISLVYKKSSSGTYLTSNADGVLQGFMRVSSVFNSVNFFQYYNFLSLNYQQNFMSLLMYLTIPVFLFYIFYKTKNIFLRTLTLIYLIFFTLTLGPKAPIFGELWMYLWNNFSAFHFFRSFSRFSITLLPIFFIAISLFYSLEKSRKSKILINYISAVFIVIVLASSHKSFSGDFGGIVPFTKPPHVYNLTNQLINKDVIKGNVLAIPSQPYELYSWGINSNTDIMKQDYYYKDFAFNNPIIYNRTSLQLDQKFKNSIFDYNIKDIKNYYQNLSDFRVGYILLQKDLLFFANLSKVEYLELEKSLDSDNNFEKIESNEYFNLYKIDEKLVLPHVISDNKIVYQKTNPTHYSVWIKNIKSTTSLEFLENFNSNWGIYAGKYKSEESCGSVIKSYFTSSSTECEPKNKFLSGIEFYIPFRKKLQISETLHGESKGYANKWYVDLEEVKKLGKDYFKENQDGTFDIKLDVYFKSQSYFVYGITISAITLITCIIFLCYYKFYKAEDK